MKLSVRSARHQGRKLFAGNSNIRIGSTPADGHVSRPVGQPADGSASAGVSSIISPSPPQPPWKV
jgi:hypothetical protein